MRGAAAFLLVLLLARPAGAVQFAPLPPAGESRIQTVPYVSGQVIPLSASPGYQVMIELAPDERIETVAVGDNGAWQINASRGGNRLFLKPVTAASTTNMTVVTDVRTYLFDLTGTAYAGSQQPYTVKFEYPDAKASVSIASTSSRRAEGTSTYRIGGDRLLRPLRVWEDGRRTFVEWPKSADLGAVYMLDRSGHESLVNGMMGVDDIYVIDGVIDRLTFRADRRSAEATRLAKRGKR